ncbi:hypothetical protein TNCV_4822831 [Trichonephila clavipes]|nr:hypothetical protein TNCV_4822831 [Trichonephila clavipes]
MLIPLKSYQRVLVGNHFRYLFINGWGLIFSSESEEGGLTLSPTRKQPTDHWASKRIGLVLFRPDTTRGLLVTDHVILNHGQVMWMTPELAPPPPLLTTTPTGGRLSSRQIERALLAYTAGLKWYWARTRAKASHDPIPRLPRSLVNP